MDSALSSLESAQSALKKPFNAADYVAMPYKDVARNPDNYIAQQMFIKGKVLQVVEGDSEITLRVATSGNYDNVVLVSYESSLTKSRVLEEDNVTIYGLCLGVTTYESTMGGKITIPALIAEKIDIN